jgi:hypothetical protein
MTKAHRVFATLGIKNILPTLVTVISRRNEIAIIEDIWDKE